VKDPQQLATALQLVHQNQVLLAEAVQVMSSWCLRHGLAELGVGLQPLMERVTANCVRLDRVLDAATHGEGYLAPETLCQVVAACHR